MQAEVIRFISPSSDDTVTQAVYLKSRWADPWGTAKTDLWCQEAVWTVGGSFSTAQIVYRYDDGLAIGAAEFARLFPLTRLRFYVRVDFTNFTMESEALDDTVRSWYGVIDAELDEQLAPDLVTAGDTVTAYPRGRNHFMAYGLEALLAQSWVDQSAVKSGDSVAFVKRALSLNPGLADYNPDPCETTGEGNRSTAKTDKAVYAFHGSRTGGQPWSTSTAVDSMLTYETVRDWNEEQLVPFVLYDPDAALPDWDEPTLQREGRNVYDLLQTLIGRQRGLAWRIEVLPAAEQQGADQVEVVPCTLVTSDLVIDEQKKLKANPNQKILCWEQDRGADPVIRRCSSETIDQVIVRGERRTSTASFSFGEATLAIGWPAALETAYEQAASTAGDYPPVGEDSARQFANYACREADKFKVVFARFTLDEATGGYVGNGTSNLADQVLMPSDADEDDPEPWAPDDQRFLPFTAMLEGVVYDGDVIGSGNPPNVFQLKPLKHKPPLVLFPRPNIVDGDQTQRYRQAEKIGLTADQDQAGWGASQSWTAGVHIDNDDGALWVVVHNGQQWVIAKTDFTPLADVDPTTDEIPGDYRQMIVTATVPWSSFAEVRYPAQVDLPHGFDALRRQLIKAPFHRVDYIVADTVVAIDEKTGTLLRNDRAGFIRDDRDKMEQIAKLAYAWYGQERKAISFSTTLVNNRLELGDLIVSIGDPDIEGDVHTEDVNSIITLIRIVMPLAEGMGEVLPPAPRIEYQTAFGELDVLQLVPRARQR